MENANPRVREPVHKRIVLEMVEGVVQDVTRETVFELIRDIRDPEHPMSLERLGVVSMEDVAVTVLDKESLTEHSGDESDGEPEAEECLCTAGLPVKCIDVEFTPTVPHCSMAGIIGLCIVRRLEQCTRGYWIRVRVKDGTHANDRALSKQLSDRDRVMAAFENDGLLEVLDSCIEGR